MDIAKNNVFIILPDIFYKCFTFYGVAANLVTKNFLSETVADKKKGF